MARFKDHAEALRLRRQGFSYSQIKNTLKVNKSTLSGWLKNYPLSKERISELQGNNQVKIERFRETMRQKKEKRLSEYYQEQQKILLPLSKRELFIAGLFLYWGEGTKRAEAVLSISNTDPAMLIFFIKWLENCFKVPKTKLKVYLHLYSDMNIEKEKNFWSEALNIPTTQFNKSYIKNTFLTNINHKGGFGHGTCNVKIGNARLTEKVLMSLKAISDTCL